MSVFKSSFLSISDRVGDIHVYTNHQQHPHLDKESHTRPLPVLKNLFLVPLWDFNLSNIAEVADNSLDIMVEVRDDREVEAICNGRKNRARSDIVDMNYTI
jgi:hypothetical protein